MSSAKVTNNNQNVKNPMYNGYSSNNRWESIAIFGFNSIPPCLQRGNGKENNAVAMVTYKISSEIFSISQREAYPLLLKHGWISYIKPTKGMNFKEFKELKKVLSYSI